MKSIHVFKVRYMGVNLTWNLPLRFFKTVDELMERCHIGGIMLKV